MQQTLQLSTDLAVCCFPHPCSQVSAVEVDSHELFVLADDIRSVVVHVGPHEISRSPTS